jgi:hypothetical protein
MACFQAAELGSSLSISSTNSWSPDAFGSGNSLTPLSRMHSANFTVLSRLVAFLLPPLLAVAVPVLPFSAEPFEQPAPIRRLWQKRPGAEVFYSCHCCILGSCVGSA